MGCPALTVNAMDSIVCSQQRPDVLALLLSRQPPEHDMHRVLQLVMSLLECRRLEALSGLCCEMSQEGHVTYMATLLAEAARFERPPHTRRLSCWWTRRNVAVLLAARQRATFAACL